MEGDERRPAATAAAFAVVRRVLDDDDLLNLVLLRLGFPTTLVRAALVCRRWLHLISEGAFLTHFRDLHPPRLLGFYRNARFVPVPQPHPPELAAVIRGLATHSFGNAEDEILLTMDCRNGRVFSLRIHDRGGVALALHRPLHPPELAAAVPPFPRRRYDDRAPFTSRILSTEQGDGSTSYLYVEFFRDTDYSSVRVYMLRDGAWLMRASARVQVALMQWDVKPVLVGDRIYIAASLPLSGILVLDLSASSFSMIQLPQGVQYGAADTTLSRTDDASGVYLICLNELQLRIWLHKQGGGDWLLVDTVVLRDMVAGLRDIEDAPFRIIQVGDNAESLFFQMGRFVLYLDIKLRSMHKVYEISEDEDWGSIHPFMMIWPPTFPKLEFNPNRFAFWSLQDDPYHVAVEVTLFCHVHLPSCCLLVLL